MNDESKSNATSSSLKQLNGAIAGRIVLNSFPVVVGATIAGLASRASWRPASATSEAVARLPLLFWFIALGSFSAEPGASGRTPGEALVAVERIGPGGF